MMRINAWTCSLCGKEVKPGQEKYLQLIDRDHRATTFEKDDIVVLSPTVLWEYCLCPDCFNTFNNSARTPYTGYTCWKCGKRLTAENISNVMYCSNPPKYTCKECEYNTNA